VAKAAFDLNKRDFSSSAFFSDFTSFTYIVHTKFVSNSVFLDLHTVIYIILFSMRTFSVFSRM